MLLSGRMILRYSILYTFRSNHCDIITQHACAPLLTHYKTRKRYFITGRHQKFGSTSHHVYSPSCLDLGTAGDSKGVSDLWQSSDPSKPGVILAAIGQSQSEAAFSDWFPSYVPQATTITNLQFHIFDLLLGTLTVGVCMPVRCKWYNNVVGQKQLATGPD